MACPGNYPGAYSTCPRCQLPLVYPVVGKVWYIDSLIGRGGMGAVFLAHNVEDRRKRAAVKVLVSIAGEMKADRTDRMTRFTREASAMRRLTHVNIVELYDFVRERDGSLYLAMEYLEGPSLSKILKERGPLPAAEAVSLCLPVLSALEAAHKVGVIHRDIKPDNIVLSTQRDGNKESTRIKVVDFGVARLKGESVTDAGQALGTPAYMAPEQAQGNDIDERVDIYGVGVVLYELLTGQPPFLPPEAPNPNMAVLALIMTTDPEPPRARNAEISPALEAVVMRAMCRDRDQRYRSAAEFSAALQAALERPDDVTWTRPAVTPALVLPPAVAAASQMASQISAPSRSSRPAMPAPPLSSRSLSQSAAGSSRSLPPSAAIPPAASRALAGAASLSGSNASLTKAGASRTYKMLMVVFYLLLVSILLISLLVDRASCR